MNARAAETTDCIRLDKWLWTARFFKTRQLAVEAISGGKIQVDGHRAKPGKSVRPGTRLIVHKGSLEWDLVIRGISRQRRPAPEAALLYEESEESRLRRQDQVRERRLSGAAAQAVKGKPSKRDRRMIQRFTRTLQD